MNPPQNQGDARRFSAASGKVDFLSFCLWNSRKSEALLYDYRVRVGGQGLSGLCGG